MRVNRQPLPYNIFRATATLVFLSIVLPLSAWHDVEESAYKAQLNDLRAHCHILKDAPEADYFFFGMGNRTKLIYQKGKLSTLADGVVVHDFGPIEADTIMPDRYEVRVRLTNGQEQRIRETEHGVYIGKRRVAGTGARLRLPSFAGHRYDRVLRVLHHEVLFNIQPDGSPLPNAELYQRPFYRDAAYAMMVLKATRNEHVMKPWATRLTSVYDHARSDDYEEADNIGQALYVISPWGGKQKAFRQQLLSEAERLAAAGADGHKYITGLVDNMECPVYATAWLITGLVANGLDTAAYALPDLPDSYTDLCWWLPQRSSQNEAQIMSETFEWQTKKKNIRLYPYLNEARAHYYNDLRLMILSRASYPLTWEQVWKEDGGYECRTHLWAAAELFLLIKTLS